MYGAHKSEIEAEWESKWSFYAFIYWKFTTSLYNLINAFNSTQTMKNHNNDWSKKNLIYNAMPFFFEHFNSNFQQNKKTWFNWNSSFLMNLAIIFLNESPRIFFSNRCVVLYRVTERFFQPSTVKFLLLFVWSIGSLALFLDFFQDLCLIPFLCDIIQKSQRNSPSFSLHRFLN